VRVALPTIFAFIAVFSLGFCYGLPLYIIWRIRPATGKRFNMGLQAPYRERLRAYFDSVPYPCLVDVKGRFSRPRFPTCQSLRRSKTELMTLNTARRINGSSNSRACAGDGRRRSPRSLRR
jgi:hypothetical protein